MDFADDGNEGLMSSNNDEEMKFKANYQINNYNDSFFHQNQNANKDNKKKFWKQAILR